jgi:hypothetical protein
LQTWKPNQLLLFHSYEFPKSDLTPTFSPPALVARSNNAPQLSSETKKTRPMNTIAQIHS